MSFLKGVKKFLSKVYELLNDERTEEVFEAGMKAMQVIIAVIGMFNSEPPGDKKREISRQVLKFLTYAEVAQLEALLELKKTGHLDSLDAEDRDVMQAVTGFILKAERNGIDVSALSDE